METSKRYFTTTEIIIYFGSVLAMIASFFIANKNDYVTLIASVIGATFLILNAKGNVWGQVLTVVFSLFYGYISYTTAYYGEMITYLFMSAPIAMVAVITWFKNPYKDGIRPEVRVNILTQKDYIIHTIGAFAVTFMFYFILRYFGTARLILSTLSIFTSFMAASFTMRRCEYFALWYALNDFVLLGLWIFATIDNRRYLSMVVCFVVFFVNDAYAFINWKRIKKKQLEVYGNLGD